MKNYVLLAIAILAGILAFVLAQHQIRKQYNKLQQSYQQVLVLAFWRDMLKGDTIQEEHLGKRPVFVRDFDPQMIKLEYKDDLIGRKMASDVKKAVPVRWRDVVVPRVRGGGSMLSQTIEPGERALSVAVDQTSSVSGMIEPGDHIDVIATFRFPATEGQQGIDTVTLTLLQNVTVLAVGQKLPRQAGQTEDLRSGRGYSNVTLAVTPKEAEMLVFAQQKGNLVMTMRNLEDVQVEREIQDVDWAYLKDHLKTYMQERETRILERVRNPR